MEGLEEQTSGVVSGMELWMGLVEHNNGGLVQQTKEEGLGCNAPCDLGVNMMSSPNAVSCNMGGW